MSKDKAFKADLVAKDGGYKTHAKKAKKGSDRPAKKPKFAKPKTTANSKAEARAKFYKGKGLKFSAD
jgi:hypothetical protein